MFDMQEYARQMGNCLMELQQNSTSALVQQLQTWAVEMQSLIVSVVLSSPGRMKEFNNSRMDDGSSCIKDRPANFYPNLVVSPPAHPPSFCMSCQVMASQKRFAHNCLLH